MFGALIGENRIDDDLADFARDNGINIVGPSERKKKERPNKSKLKRKSKKKMAAKSKRRNRR